MGWVKDQIYKAKRAVHRRPALYKAMYDVLTVNRETVAGPFRRGPYPSAFGGMWTDRDDYQATVQFASLKEEMKPLIKDWHENGFVILPGAVPGEDIDPLVDRLDRLPEDYPEGLKIAAAHLEGHCAPYDPSRIEVNNSTRIVDLFYHFEEARKILFSEPLAAFLRTVFDKSPLLTQSLSFEYGSGQPLHQDTSFVTMTSPMHMAAVWVALEDVQPGAGALAYMPGSHRWGDYRFNGHFKHYDEERDGPEALQDWAKWMEGEAAVRNAKPSHFRAKKGDVLLWHAGLVHGGSPITDPSLTRRSLVAHYCPTHIRPLYHFYKPGHRKIYRDGIHQYTTSYYP
ncbi:MAG: phytanoyl-CoA dioxygenase family protein [Pseudomonadota bacterium]